MPSLSGGGRPGRQVDGHRPVGLTTRPAGFCSGSIDLQVPADQLDSRWVHGTGRLDAERATDLMVCLGVISDYESANERHLATTAAAQLAGADRGSSVEVRWVPTQRVEDNSEEALAGLDAVHHPALVFPRRPDHAGPHRRQHSGVQRLPVGHRHRALLLQPRPEPGRPGHHRAGRAGGGRHGPRRRASDPRTSGPPILHGNPFRTSDLEHNDLAPPTPGRPVRSSCGLAVQKTFHHAPRPEAQA